MGRRSTRKNKSIYQTSREAAGLTREAAEETLVFVSADRIDRIERGVSAPHPDEVLAMAEGYKDPVLCNHYCARECPIGQKTVPELSLRELSQITVDVLAGLNALDKQKERLTEITVDGEISPEEFADFRAIRDKLDQMSAAIDSLKLWIEARTMSGELDKEILE